MIKKYLLALMQQDVLRAFQRRRCVGHGEQMVKKIHYCCRCFSSTHIHNSVCNEQQECIPVGCVPSAAVAVCWGGGACSRGMPGRGGCLLLGGACSRGPYSQGDAWLGGGCSQGGSDPGGVVSQHALRQTPLWTDTHLLKHNLRNFVADGNYVS